MQVLADLLKRNEKAITERWLERILVSYSPDTANFFLRQQNRFANPVGQTFAEQSGIIVAGLLNGGAGEVLGPPLEDIVKIRAIQELSPSEAVGFVFLLKDVIREIGADVLDEPEARQELQALESRIDKIALLTFDIFVSCRERVYSLRLREIRAGFVQPG